MSETVWFDSGDAVLKEHKSNDYLQMLNKVTTRVITTQLYNV